MDLQRYNQFSQHQGREGEGLSCREGEGEGVSKRSVLSSFQDPDVFPTTQQKVQNFCPPVSFLYVYLDLG